MQASIGLGGHVTLSMTIDEAVIVHLKIADSEFAEDLDVVKLFGAVDKKVFSDVQQALAPVIPHLGTESYPSSIDAAYGGIDPGPFEQSN